MQETYAGSPLPFPANSYPRFFAGMTSYAVVLIAASLPHWWIERRARFRLRYRGWPRQIG
jgi:hypothetical protein